MTEKINVEGSPDNQDGKLQCSQDRSQERMTGFRPLGDQILCRLDPEEEEKVSGIILVKQKEIKIRTAKVIAIGSGAVNRGGIRVAVEPKVGDKVMLVKPAATEVHIDGETLHIIQENGIIGIIE